MQTSKEFNAGVFLISALALLFGSVWLLGQERQIFSSNADFFVTFKDVRGLSEGAPVRLGGITVGRVAGIGFPDNLDDLNIHVDFVVNTRYLARIRQDASASIQTQGLLGDKFLSINPGKDPINLNPGSLMKSSDAGGIDDVLEQAGKIVDTTVEIADSVNEFLKEFKTETLKNLSEGAKSFSEILDQVQNGKGLVHRLVYSEKDGVDVLKHLEETSANLNSISSQIKSGEGLLHALIYDPSGKKTVESLGTAAQNLSDTATTITAIAKEIKEGKGLLHYLVYEKSPQGVDQIIDKLNQTATNFQEASRALAQGTGTIGALLIDSQLYDNLVEVTDGAKRSFILRQAIKSSLAESKPK